MALEKTLEGNLRPIYEFRTAAIHLPIAATSLVIGPYIGLPDIISFGFSGTLTALAYVTYKQGCKIRDYQRSLTVIEPFFVKTTTIPFSKNATWLGKGFEVTHREAQRVWDAGKPHLKEYYELPQHVLDDRENEMRVETGVETNPKAIRRANFTKKRVHTPSDYLEWYVGKHALDMLSVHHLKKLVPKIAHGAIDRFDSGLSAINKKLGQKNHYAPLPPVGGSSIYHGVGVDKETDQMITHDERLGNFICFGQSRVGKTRVIEVLISQDIARGDSSCVCLDPKGDAELLARMWVEAKRNNREDNFYIFALGFTDISARYNAIGTFSRITAVATRISNNMAASGDGAVFKDFAFRFMTIVAQALVYLGETPTFGSMKRYIEDLEPLYIRYAKKFLSEHVPDYQSRVKEILNPPPKKLKTKVKGVDQYSEQKMAIPAYFKGRSREMVALDTVLQEFFYVNPHLQSEVSESLRSALKNDISYYGKITASLIPLLTKLSTGSIKEIISPDTNNINDERPIISWKKIIQNNSIVWCGLDAMTDSTVASSVGAMFFSDLVNTAGDIYKHGIDKGLHNAKRDAKNEIWLYCDEFQSLASPDIVPILNRAAGAGVRLQAFTQALSDIEEGFGDPATAGVVLGNFNSVMMLRVKGEDTAQFLVDQVTKCDLLGIDAATATNGNTDSLFGEAEDEESESGTGWFSTRMQVKVMVEAHEPIISTSNIMGLPRGQAYAVLNGQRLVKLRFPLLEEVPGYEAPSMDYLIDLYRRKYKRDSRLQAR